MAPDLWQQLAPPKPGPPFDPDVHLEGLPEPARRYFVHAIRPGTPLAGGAELRMRGSIRAAGYSMPFRASERIVPSHGFEWRVRAGRGPIVMRGSDWYADGRGGLRMRLFGLITVADAGGENVSRSAAGRLAVEAIWVPASMLPRAGGAAIAVTETGFAATLRLDGEEHTVRVSVAEDGAVREVAVARWGDVGTDGAWRRIPFGARVQAERSFGGYTIPSELRVGWWHGTERAAEHEILRARIDGAAFAP